VDQSTGAGHILKDYGPNSLRANDKIYPGDRNPWKNVCIYMLCCRYGIAILGDREADELHANVALEYGFMRALNRQVLLLVGKGFSNVKADIIGTLRTRASRRYCWRG
jgi:hypothetical protein